MMLQIMKRFLLFFCAFILLETQVTGNVFHENGNGIACIVNGVGLLGLTAKLAAKVGTRFLSRFI